MQVGLAWFVAQNKSADGKPISKNGGKVIQHYIAPSCSWAYVTTNRIAFVSLWKDAT